MLQHVLILHSLLWLSILFKTCPRFCSLIGCWYLGSCFSGSFAINIYVCTSFCVDINFHFSGNRVAESCGNSVYLAFWGPAQLFSKVAAPSHTLSILHSVWGSLFLHCLVSTYYYLSFIVATLWDVAWCLIVGLICISLTTDHVGHFFMCLLATCIFSNPSPIEKM